MDWPNERYVRRYTRETVDDASLSYLARGLWDAILPRLDRAGILDLGRHGARGISALIRWPLAEVRDHLPELLEDGRLELRQLESGAQFLFAPNYMEAQECKQTDKQRQRDSRERRAARARVAELGLGPITMGDVTERDEDTPIGDTSSPVVTNGHILSQRVTPSLAVLSQAVLSQANLLQIPVGSDPRSPPTEVAAAPEPEPEEPEPQPEPQLEDEAQEPEAEPDAPTHETGTNGRGRAQRLPGYKTLKSAERKKAIRDHYDAALSIWVLQDELREKAAKAIGTTVQTLKPTAERLARIAMRLEAGATEAECVHVLRVCVQEAKAKGSMEYFNGTSTWTDGGFAYKVGQPLDDPKVFDEDAYRKYADKKKAEYLKKHGTL